MCWLFMFEYRHWNLWKNYIVCENYIYRDRTHYDTLIKRIDRKEEFRNQANTSFTIEIDKLG